MRRVVLESPYKGLDWKNTEKNLEYARLCFHDCLAHGDNPFASHLIYTQPGILDDKVPEERNLGISAGLDWGQFAEATVVYIERGISQGMKYGIARAQRDGRPVEYRTLFPTGIVTITGPSGVGKTSIAKKILEIDPDVKLVLSLTTRDPRTSDLPGEYRANVPAKEFGNRLKIMRLMRSLFLIPANDKFLWVVQAHGNTYGTLLESVDEALAAASPSLMLLVPSAVLLLRKHAQEKRVLSFYVLSPSSEELRKRLHLRGENESTIERRIADCRQWDEEARNSEIPYIFLTNEEQEVGVEKAAREILEYLGRAC